MEPDTRMPVARREDLVTTQSGEELLVYDQRRYHLHHLNPFAAAVWRACDGQRSVPAIAAWFQPRWTSPSTPARRAWR